MKPICNTFFALLGALLVSIPAAAQTPTHPQGGVIDLAAYVDEATTVQIGEANATALKNKISKIITRNGMADAEGFFAVVPTFSITDTGTVDTGMATIQVVRVDFTLSVKNTVDNTVFASQTIALEANGRGNVVWRALINKVNVNDVRFAKMIQDVQKSITDYYTRQMPRIMNKVNTYIAQKAYSDALVALSMVPETVAEYPKACELKVEVYNKLLSDEITKALAEADIMVRQGNIDGALALCRSCNPLSPNYNQVVQFLNRLDAQAAAAEAAALEAELRKLDAAKQREKAAEEAELRGETLKAEKADKCKKKGKSLGEVLFGL